MSIPNCPVGLLMPSKRSSSLPYGSSKRLQRGLRTCPMGLLMPSKRSSKLPYGSSNAFKEDFEFAFDEDLELPSMRTSNAFKEDFRCITRWLYRQIVSQRILTNHMICQVNGITSIKSRTMNVILVSDVWPNTNCLNKHESTQFDIQNLKYLGGNDIRCMCNNKMVHVYFEQWSSYQKQQLNILDNCHHFISLVHPNVVQVITYWIWLRYGGHDSQRRRRRQHAAMS